MLFDMFFSYIQNIILFVLHVTGPGSFPHPLSSKEEKKYLVALSKNDPIARSKLIEHNLRLVAHIVKKYYSSANEQDDLVSIGTIGLIKAIDTFDVNKGIRLSSYAARCIENEVLMFFRNAKKSAQDVSMNDPIDTDKNGNALVLMDIMATEDSIVDDLDIKIKSEKLYNYIKKSLPTREQAIIQLRYGLNGTSPLTQREVALKLGISRSYVSRIEKKALLTLKKQFEKNSNNKH